MAAIHQLISQVPDPALRERLQQEADALTHSRSFGLVFERHLPEVTPMHGARPRRGDTVAVRGEPLNDLWRVQRMQQGQAHCLHLTRGEAHTWPLDQLFVARRFGEPIFPSLVPMDKVANGPADAPWHVLIEADNYHALQLLEYLYAGQVDCIYIDPPYNTGARDWKYNNDYVDENDAWRHSKWLSFMERRLRLAKRLLNPNNSVLIVTIDENELNNLALVLAELFPDATRQMVSSVINPRGVHKDGNFSRCNEYLLFVMIGSAKVAGDADDKFMEGSEVPWRTLRRSDLSSARGMPKGGSRQFFPIYVNDRSGKIDRIGEPLSHHVQRSLAPTVPGCTAVFPIRPDGTEMNWGLTPESVVALVNEGYVQVGAHKPDEPQRYVISYLTTGKVADIRSGKATVVGRKPCGAVIAKYLVDKERMPTTNWVRSTHNAETQGSNLLRDILGDKRFPFPKSLYAVSDCIRYFTKENKAALVLDFFGGSGTTLHAVLSLNQEDDGRRRCILVTNNEVSEAQSSALTQRSILPIDDEWQQLGICRAVTWPRSKFAVLGHRDDGVLLPGEYITAQTRQVPRDRRFRHVSFLDAAALETAAKRRQFVALLEGLPQTVVSQERPFIVSEDHALAVLFDEGAAPAWLDALDAQPHVTDFVIVAPRKNRFDEIKAAVVDLLGPAMVSEELRRPMSEGFPANLEYFRLDFLDPEQVALKRQFREVLPLLWMRSGCIGPRPTVPASAALPPWLIPDANRFAVLLDEARLRDFLPLARSRSDLTHVFLVTDSEDSFQEMAAELQPGQQPVQLYRDYLENFLINRGDRA